MVKFGKYLKANRLNDYKYIDYKALKQILNEIYVKARISMSQLEVDENDVTKIENEFFLEKQEICSISDKLSNEQKFSNNINSSSYESQFNSFKRKMLKIFTSKLDREIEAFYKCFIEKEKYLFQTLNTHLHNRTKYNTYSLIDFVREIEDLYRLSIQAECMNRYVIINFQCIRKILKKLDKKMKEFYNNTSISVRYIRTKLNHVNTDIHYILKFKIVDEISTLLESVAGELNQHLIKLKGPKMYKESDMQFIDVSNNPHPLQADLLNEVIENNCYTFECKRKFNVFLKGITITVNNINNMSTFRVNPLEASEFDLNDNNTFSNKNIIDIKEDNISITTSQYVTSLKDGGNKNIISSKDNDFLHTIKLFVTEEAYNDLIKDHKKILSEKNNSNKNVLLFHSLLYSFIYAMIISGLPIYFHYENKKSVYNCLHIGASFLIIHLGIMTNKIIVKSAFKNRPKKYLYGMFINIFSLVIAIAAYFYIKKTNLTQNDNFLYFIYPTLFLIGNGISGQLNQEYFNEYIPRLPYITVSYYEKLFKIFGFILGITSPFLFDYIIIIVFILLLLSSFCFSSPSNDSFTILNTHMISHAKINESASNSINQKADDELKKINEEKNYTYSNSIPSNMKKLITIEQSFQRKLFSFIMIHLLCSNFINYSALYLLSFYFIEMDFDKSIYHLPFLCLIPFLAEAIVDLIIFPIVKQMRRLRQRTILIILEFIIVIWCIFLALSIYEPDLVPQKHLYDNSLGKIILLSLMTIVNYLFEYIERDYYDTEMVLKFNWLNNGRKLSYFISESAKVIGVIVAGLLKLVLITQLNHNHADDRTENEKFALDNQLKLFIFIHLLIYIILLAGFVIGLLMKNPFIHKPLHRLMKEKFY